MSEGWTCSRCSTVNVDERQRLLQLRAAPVRCRTRPGRPRPPNGQRRRAVHAEQRGAGRRRWGRGGESTVAATPTPAEEPSAIAAIGGKRVTASDMAAYWVSPGGDQAGAAPDGIQDPGAPDGGHVAGAPDGDQGAASKAAIPIWRRIPIGWLVVAVFVAGGAVVGWYFNASRSSSGEITKTGDMMAVDLRVGDCFDLKDPAANEIEDVTASPCTVAHEFEMFFVGSLPEGAFPPDSVFETYVTAELLPGVRDVHRQGLRRVRAGHVLARPDERSLERRRPLGPMRGVPPGGQPPDQVVEGFELLGEAPSTPDRAPFRRSNAAVIGPFSEPSKNRRPQSAARVGR